MKNHHTIKLVTLLILCGCSSSPYFVELDPRSKSANAAQYGEGVYFYHYSKIIFPSMTDAKAKEEYFNFVQTDIDEKLDKNAACEIIQESLSYNSEGGEVSVLVKCNET
ncbi:hypothetical protein [Arsukibacterium indicum]|uniref:Lipoprotein n=1 Tax=Arsukibacterium indicum TaxID=2848612 RepID=A0ABS6MRV4_9GAMM|nr:hypothetical protein [Arsukibacterium indicum]MBV2131164.1 hypothetical protein [Arsukibacterium indicum]